MCHQLDNERCPEGNKAKISYVAGYGRFVLSKPMLAKSKFELCVVMNLIMYDNSGNLAKLLIIELGQEALLPLKI
jgi:hypothetical protein